MQNNTSQSEMQKPFILKYIPLLPVDRSQLINKRQSCIHVPAEESGKTVTEYLVLTTDTIY